MNLDDSASQATDPSGADEDSVNPEQVVDVALELFAEHGYTEAKLEQVAKTAGMSKRMIHYHFGDKMGLYHQTLIEAMHRVHPDPEAMELDSTVPVEGVRKIVDALHRQFHDEPTAARLILMENLHGFTDLEEIPPFYPEASILLNLDKLLMLGQDAGAFRPGISAEDVFLLISAVSGYPIMLGATSKTNFGVDLSSGENVAGLHRLVVDTVLAFLTSNIPDTGKSSYLRVASGDVESQSTPDIYSDEL